MIGNNIWTDEARRHLLHVLPQQTYHASAEICGSPDALRRLGEALIEASVSRQGGDPTSVEMMASDGEGYTVEIYAMSDQQMDSGPLPYAQLGNIWEFDQCFECPRKVNK